MSSWDISGGSMIGRNHRLVGKNNQDAWCVKQTAEYTVAVVADGCGSAAHSEVGASIGAQLTVELLSQQASSGQEINWRQLERAVMSQLDVLVRALALPYREAIERFCLFTLVGVVIGPERSVFFVCGDGIVVTNGVMTELGPFPGNMPPYLAYQLLESELQLDPDLVRIKPLLEMPTHELSSFLLGTDGVTDLARLEHQMRPGLETTVGPLAQFWQNDRYFRGNPELISRELKLIGRDWPLQEPEPGLLGDDTTMIVGRHRLVDGDEL